MKRRGFEKTFAAAAFAEAGEHETAMKMMGITPAYELVRKFADFMERHFSAVSFAEAGCHDEAARLCGAGSVRNSRHDSLETFLETVGLGNVRVCYGLASI
jgi:hypothetical protein